MIATLRRAGGLPPASNELLEIHDDGSFWMRRVDAVGAVGIFAGTLTEDLLARVSADAQACAETRPPPAQPGGPPLAGGPPPATVPDSEQERFDVADRVLVLGVYDDPPPDWESLVATLRKLIDALLDQPVAAIALDVAVAPPTASLRHVGSQALSPDPPTVELTVIVWDADGHVAAERRLTIPVPEVATATDWELPLPLDVPAPTSGQWLQVDVALAFTVGGGRHRGTVHRVVEA